MKKIIMAFVIFSASIFSANLPCFAAQDINQPQKTSSQTGSEDIAGQIEKTADIAEEKIDQFSSQLERIFNIVEEKYKSIAPKIKKMRDFMEKKMQDIKKEKEGGLQGSTKEQ